MSYEDTMNYDTQLNDDIPSEIINNQMNFSNPYMNDWEKMFNTTNSNIPPPYNNSPYDTPNYNPLYNPTYNSPNYNPLYNPTYDNPYENPYDNQYDNPFNKTSIINKEHTQNNHIRNFVNESNKDNFPYEITDSNIVDDLVNIYEQTKEEYIEFIDVKFNFNELPKKFLDLIFVTELVVKNCKLKELKYLPPNVQKITFNKCGLQNISCKHFHKNIFYINFADNNIEIITDIIDSVKELILDDNKLSFLDNLPNSIQILSLKNNFIDSTDFIKYDIKKLNLFNNNIKDISNINVSIEEIELSKNNLSVIKKFPLNIKTIVAYSCNISKICCNFPDTLEKLDLYNNKLERVPDFNFKLEWVDLSNNDLCVLPHNIDNLKYFDISANSRLKFDGLNKDWIAFMNCKSANDQFIMDIDEDDDDDDDDINNYNLTDNISTDTTDSLDNIQQLLDNESDKSDKSDNNNFKLRIANMNKNDDFDELDELDEHFNIRNVYPKENHFNIQNNTICDKDTISSIIKNINKNNINQNNIYKPKRIVKSLKTLTI